MLLPLLMTQDLLRHRDARLQGPLEQVMPNRELRNTEIHIAPASFTIPNIKGIDVLLSKLSKRQGIETKTSIND
ncbi:MULTISPECIES: hypothetical protein [unclassified Paraburkholderia]|uniref:hypothetical protein n=1 Tax=unclassified Paraburkholderia TaxID=2615204 RepID=UPI00160709BA|nr:MULTISPECIES: hypothetical protein [unclassified Paraburkholderia]MBB5446843.1 hypothetical protein [Paraburkholderia sp. WSM4177]MBB5487288.1 hypothetical protein [Paraburkholderia sp. WSM4180]